MLERVLIGSALSTDLDCFPVSHVNISYEKIYSTSSNSATVMVQRIKLFDVLEKMFKVSLAILTKVTGLRFDKTWMGSPFAAAKVP